MPPLSSTDDPPPPPPPTTTTTTTASSASSSPSPSTPLEPISVLFVCLGNICRSTMAEGVFRHLTGHLPASGDIPGQTTTPNRADRSGGRPQTRNTRNRNRNRTGNRNANANANANANGDGDGNRDRLRPLISRIDSAGTGAYHVFEPPDPRTRETLAANGIHGYDHGARKVTARDFEEFDYVFAMDRYNFRDLQRMARRGAGAGAKKAKVMMWGVFSGGSGGGLRGGRRNNNNGHLGEEEEEEEEEHAGMGEEVIDPYYGGDEGFQEVYGQCVRFTEGFIREVLEGRRGEERRGG